MKNKLVQVGKIEIKKKELAHTASYTVIADQKKARLVQQEYEPSLLKKSNLLKLVSMPALSLIGCTIHSFIPSLARSCQIKVIKPP